LEIAGPVVVNILLANEGFPSRTGYYHRTVEYEVFVGSNFTRNVTNFAPQKALKFIP
jgi:hypothetical protein